MRNNINNTNFYKQNKSLLFGSVSDYEKSVDEALLEVVEDMDNDNVSISKGAFDELCESASFENIMKSFKPRNKLNSNFFNEGKIIPKIKMRLLDIADDFISTFSIAGLKIEDVLLTGSMANYNWSLYSDVDLHILIDFNKINIKKEALKDYFDSKKMIWNYTHKNLSIFKHCVEVYVQDINEKHSSTGVYSLYKDKWVNEPTNDRMKLSDSIYRKVKKDSLSYKKKTDRLIKKIKEETDRKKIENYSNECEKIVDKIKRIRKSDLQENGEMSYGNLLFKVLRRTNVIKDLYDNINYAYDKINSMKINDI